MSIISRETRQSYSEIYEILNLMDVEYRDKVPKKLIEYFEKEMDENYVKNINIYEDISKQNLKKETITILAMLNLKYWADEDEKTRLNKIYNENEMKYQEEIHQKYNPDKIFDNSESSKIEDSKMETESQQLSNQESLTIIKEPSIFSKIIGFIKKLFKRK